MVDQVQAPQPQDDKDDDKPPMEWEVWATFCCIFIAACIYIVLPMLNKQVPIVPESVWVMLTAIVTTAVGYRGHRLLRGVGQ